MKWAFMAGLLALLGSATSAHAATAVASSHVTATATLSTSRDWRQVMQCILKADDQATECIALGVYPRALCEQTWGIVIQLCGKQFADQ